MEFFDLFFMHTLVRKRYSQELGCLGTCCVGFFCSPTRHCIIQLVRHIKPCVSNKYQVQIWNVTCTDSIQTQRAARAQKLHIQQVQLPLHLFNVLHRCIPVMMDVPCGKTSRNFYEHPPVICCYICILHICNTVAVSILSKG